MDTTIEAEGGLVSVAQACQYLRVGKKKLYALHRNGQLEMLKLGSSTRIPIASLQRLIKELPQREPLKK